MADQSTKYLRELEPGDQVLVYNSAKGKVCLSLYAGTDNNQDLLGYKNTL
jgi:3-dehydroquinate synthase class II